MAIHSFCPKLPPVSGFELEFLRKIVLTWTFTVDSAISILCAMHLLELPSMIQRRTTFSREEKLGCDRDFRRS